jgi:hypothetical protein
MLRREYYFGEGLCHWASKLYMHDVINNQERLLLEKFFSQNRPKNCIGSYWWPKGEIEPRIEWLKEQIKKL